MTSILRSKFLSCLIIFNFWWDKLILSHKISVNIASLKLFLSCPPSESTLEYANQLVDLTHNPPPSSSKLTWGKILEEEPLTGEHWRGAFGLPPGSIQEDRADNESTDSSPILTPVSDLADLNDTMSSIASEDTSETRGSSDSPPPLGQLEEINLNQRLAESLRLREELDNLQRRQYWQRSWRTDANPSRPFSLNDPSTLSEYVSRLRFLDT